jgi:hypothetical protein
VLSFTFRIVIFVLKIIVKIVLGVVVIESKNFYNFSIIKTIIKAKEDNEF